MHSIKYFPNVTNNNGRVLIIYKKTRTINNYFYTYSAFNYDDYNVKDIQSFDELHTKCCAGRKVTPDLFHPTDCIDNYKRKKGQPNDEDHIFYHWLSYNRNFIISDGLTYDQMKENLPPRVDASAPPPEEEELDEDLQELEGILWEF